jgi:hypothetical protein
MLARVLDTLIAVGSVRSVPPISRLSGGQNPPEMVMMSAQLLIAIVLDPVPSAARSQGQELPCDGLG